MNAVLICLVGVVLLLLLVLLAQTSRRSSGTGEGTAVIAELRQGVSRSEQELATERAAHAQTQNELTATRTRLAASEADATARQQAADQRYSDLQALQESALKEFKALSSQALDEAQTALRKYAEERLVSGEKLAAADLEKRQVAVEALVRPIKEQLTKVEASLQQTEKDRAAAQGTLLEQVKTVQASALGVESQTRALVDALRKPQARGRWGELHLRRAVELAGMVDRVDFEEQNTFTNDEGSQQRPDMKINLAGGKHVIVDSKVTLAAFLEAHETTDDAVREARLDAHARHLREHVKGLSGKEYWKSSPDTPEFVVLFIPGEAFLAPALDRDPKLMEDAAAARIILATPTTLIALLRTVSYAWNQAVLADNAREIFDLGKELHGRLSTMGEHIAKLGTQLNGAVGAYNKTVGALETRVLVTARKMQQLSGVDSELGSPSSVDSLAKGVSATELVASADQSLLALPTIDDQEFRAAGADE